MSVSSNSINEEICLKRSSTDMAVFKKPTSLTVTPKRTKKVLDEDTYILEMEKIVQRDFFPDLEKLQAQNEYLEAVANNDIQRLRELTMKYGAERLPSSQYSSPATFDTPYDTRPSDTPGKTVRAGDTKEDGKDDTSDDDTQRDNEKELSLNQYLTKYTSEDNHSFQEIMDESEKRHQTKFSWLYEPEIRHAIEHKTILALPSIEHQARDDSRPIQVDTWDYKGQNYIMYVPDGVPFSAEEQLERNSKIQQVVYNNTRFTHNPFNDSLNRNVLKDAAEVQAKTQEGKIGVDGKEIQIIPATKDYGYVKTPSPMPGVNESPLMTWGEIDSTPYRLDPSSTPNPNGPHFKIAEPPRREKLAFKLVEKASQRHRDKKNRAMQVARSNLQSPSPRCLTSMSPAAQKLAASHLKINKGMDKALRASYTPSRPTTPRTPSVISNTSRTPSIGSRTPHRTPGTVLHSESERESITDNLLQLPFKKVPSVRRHKASDFF